MRRRNIAGHRGQLNRSQYEWCLDFYCNITNYKRLPNEIFVPFEFLASERIVDGIARVHRAFCYEILCEARARVRRAHLTYDQYAAFKSTQLRLTHIQHASLINAQCSEQMASIIETRIKMEERIAKICSIQQMVGDEDGGGSREI